MEKYIRAARLIDGTGQPAQDDPILRILGDRVAEVLVNGKLVEIPESAEVLEFRECTILPGLIDSHVHLEFGCGSDHPSVIDEFERAGELGRLVTAVANAQLALCAGITTVRDCGGGGVAALAARDAFRSGRLTGPRILAAGAPITTTGGHLHFCHREADSADEVRKATRQLMREGVDFIKIMATGGNMTSGSNPLAPQFTVCELRSAVDEAHRLGRHVAAHALCYEGIKRCLSAGIDTIEHCIWSDHEGALQFEPALAQQMVSRGTSVSVTVTSAIRACLPLGESTAAEYRSALDALEKHFAPFRAMNEIGVRLMLSSDAGVRLTRFEQFWQGLVAMVLGMGMTPVTAISATTRAPAEGLGLGRELGTVEPGKLADLVVVDGRPDQDVRDVERVRAVFISGRLVVADGRISTPSC